MARDSQRAKFWRCYRKGLSAARQPLRSQQEADDFVARVLATRFVSDVSGDLPKLEVVTKLGKSGGTSFPRYVDSYTKTSPREWTGYPLRVLSKLSRSQRSEADALVHVAYAIARRHKSYRGEPAAWHGWQFCSVLYSLVRELYGDDAARQLADSYKEHRVQWKPPAQPKRVGMDARVSAAERLIANRTPGLWSIKADTEEGLLWVALSSRWTSFTSTPAKAKVWDTKEAAERALSTLRKTGKNETAYVAEAPPLGLQPPEVDVKTSVVWSLGASSPGGERGDEDIASLKEKKMWETLQVEDKELRLSIRERFENDPTTELEEMLQVCEGYRVTPQMYLLANRRMPMSSRELELALRYRLIRAPRDYTGLSKNTVSVLSTLRRNRPDAKSGGDRFGAQAAIAAISAALVDVVGYDEWNSGSIHREFVSTSGTNQAEWKTMIEWEALIGGTRGLRMAKFEVKETRHAVFDSYLPLPTVNIVDANDVIQNWEHETLPPLYLPVAVRTKAGQKPVHSLWLPPVNPYGSHHQPPVDALARAWAAYHDAKGATSWKKAIDEAYF